MIRNTPVDFLYEEITGVSNNINFAFILFEDVNMSGTGIRAPEWIPLLFNVIIYSCASNSAFMLCEVNVSSVKSIHPGAKCPPKMEQFGGSVSALHFR